MVTNRVVKYILDDSDSNHNSSYGNQNDVYSILQNLFDESDQNKISKPRTSNNYESLLKHAEHFLPHYTDEKESGYHNSVKFTPFQQEILHIKDSLAEIRTQIDKLFGNGFGLSSWAEEGATIMSDNNEKLIEIRERLIKIETLSEQMNIKVDSNSSKLDRIEVMLQKLPQEDRIRVVVAEELRATKVPSEHYINSQFADLSEKLPSMDYVDKSVADSKLKMLLWLIGTSIATAAATGTIIQILVK